MTLEISKERAIDAFYAHIGKRIYPMLLTEISNIGGISEEHISPPTLRAKVVRTSSNPSYGGGYKHIIEGELTFTIAPPTEEEEPLKVWLSLQGVVTIPTTGEPTVHKLTLQKVKTEPPAVAFYTPCDIIYDVRPLSIYLAHAAIPKLRDAMIDLQDKLLAHYTVATKEIPYEKTYSLLDYESPAFGKFSLIYKFSLLSASPPTFYYLPSVIVDEKTGKTVHTDTIIIEGKHNIHIRLDAEKGTERIVEVMQENIWEDVETTIKIEVKVSQEIPPTKGWRLEGEMEILASRLKFFDGTTRNIDIRHSRAIFARKAQKVLPTSLQETIKNIAIAFSPQVFVDEITWLIRNHPAFTAYLVEKFKRDILPRLEEEYSGTAKVNETP